MRKHCQIGIMLTFCLLGLTIINNGVFAQPVGYLPDIAYGAPPPTEKLIKVIVSPNHEDWLYKRGESAKFEVTVLKSNVPLVGAKIYYETGLERMTPAKKDSIVLPYGKTIIDAGTLQQPGFLRCIVTTIVNAVTYRGIATVGFDPYSIEAYTILPTDFLKFWEDAKAELSKIPIDAKMTLLPERCTERTNVYQVNMLGYGKNSRLYGILCIPKKEGKYPAVLKVPGAGVRPYNGDLHIAENEIITFEIGIHGIPVTMDAQVYQNLADGALNGYQNFNLDDKNRFYYKRVYLNCIRANDFLTGLPQYDGNNLAVMGGSQGGALSIVTAALDKRVKYLSAMYPALCDLTATIKGRTGGWPNYFGKDNLAFNNKPDKIETLGYYDVVNFARQITIPGIYSWGFNDETCPPSSTFAAYNTIKASKKILIVPEIGHWGFPEQHEKVINWVEQHLKNKEVVSNK